MKKIFTLSAIVFLAAVLFTSCRKADVGYPSNENYWLSKEAGEVVYVEASCNYWVVETYNGYNIVSSSSGSKPYEGELIYGNFSSRGTRDMYNFSDKFVFTGTVTDYWLTYNQAMDALDFYCPIYGKSVAPRVFKTATKIQKKQ